MRQGGEPRRLDLATRQPQVLQAGQLAQVDWRASADKKVKVCQQAEPAEAAEHELRLVFLPHIQAQALQVGKLLQHTSRACWQGAAAATQVQCRQLREAG